MLIEASWRGDEDAPIDVVKELIKQGANVDAAMPWGRTALYFAADGCRVEIVKALIEAGADPMIRDTAYFPHESKLAVEATCKCSYTKKCDKTRKEEIITMLNLYMADWNK